ncbi:hypothetical protein ColLi_08992 [Colletotrichum liriopes]|uniref:Uncharacterized protein n=1 Tax=Colletotrichum liriopes TaxID=708192 RepID=A0AA37LVC2_9PEZI|nr:hypothetical protein ColLi_08992 [Colletotrichum liriopes]
MCQAEKWWCIGCRKVRLGLQKCEKFDPVADLCESTSFENPPLKPVFEHCDNLECKYLDPALAWHPDRPLSPDSQAFAVWLKDVNDKMDSPSTAAPDATGAGPKAVSLQMKERIGKASASDNTKIQGPDPLYGNSSGIANTSSVRMTQLLETSTTGFQFRTNIPSEHAVAASGREIDNASLDDSKGSSNEQFNFQLQRTNIPTSRVLNANVPTKHQNRFTNRRGQSTMVHSITCCFLQTPPYVDLASVFLDPFQKCQHCGQR